MLFLKSRSGQTKNCAQQLISVRQRISAIQCLHIKLVTQEISHATPVETTRWPTVTHIFPQFKDPLLLASDHFPMAVLVPNPQLEWTCQIIAIEHVSSEIQNMNKAACAFSSVRRTLRCNLTVKKPQAGPHQFLPEHLLAFCKWVLSSPE